MISCQQAQIEGCVSPRSTVVLAETGTQLEARTRLLQCWSFANSAVIESGFTVEAVTAFLDYPTTLPQTV